MALSVNIKADSKFPVDRKKLRSALSAAWAEYGLDGEAQVSVAVVGTRKMSQLHQEYLGRAGPTDVLAFPQQGGAGGEYGFVTPEEATLELGDIVLCYPLVLNEAAEKGVMVDEQVVELALHGMNHLLGVEE
jgi:probable rRNA maturation factor